MTFTVLARIDERFLAEHKVSLSGNEAVIWFRNRNVSVNAGKGFRLVADRLRAHDFEILRVWHTPALLDDELGRPRARWRAIIQLEGTGQLISLEDQDESYRLTVGSIVLIPGARRWRFTSLERTARITIQLNAPFHGEPADDSRPYQINSDAGEDPYRNVLVSTVNAILSSPSIQPDDPRVVAVRISVTHLLAASLASELSNQSALPKQGEDAIFDRALNAIAIRALDENFTVAKLAEELNISRQYLNRAFAQRGTTPLEQVRAVRMSAALSKLAASGLSAREATELIAHESGFKSTRAMLAAIRRSR